MRQPSSRWAADTAAEAQSISQVDVEVRGLTVEPDLTLYAARSADASLPARFVGAPERSWADWDWA